MNILLNFKSILTALCILTTAAFINSANAQQEKESREIEDFTDISFSLPGKLILKQGNTVNLKVEGSKEDLEKIVTKVSNGNLKIYTKPHVSRLNDVIVYVIFNELEGLDIAGSGDVTFESPFETEEFELSLSGSGNVVCSDLKAGEVEISLAGSGDVELGGSGVHELEISIAGSGDIDAKDLEAEEVEVSIAGSGSVKVFATKELETSIVGSGDVYYKGNPQVDAEAVGSGHTKPL